ncbi:NADPH-dependent FMN reductase [Peristeroidobacter soli]|jgi:chromate reductase|uniref:NADPH-dependent FMN reductase n=1 Tax=Peristeroidobacter soli TaxID=2497877 RepID=UPI00101DC544|nr:NADPH-dependent FMN reductase [Peristeroidobacter soli]
MAKVGLIVGSLRTGAFTRLMARALPELAPSSLEFFTLEIGDLPFYNEDLETGSPPAPWTRFRHQVRSADGILFITPEYNRSIPGVLKNALDVGSRPWGQSAWDGKPAAVIGQSPGALGGMAAAHHLRQVLLAVNLAAMPHPEAYIPAVATLFDDSGRLQNAPTREFMTGFLQAFATWLERFPRPSGQ